MKMNNKGFTLVELLAVLAIIAIIGMIAIPNVISVVDNNKKDLMLQDAQKLVSLAKAKVIQDREFRDNPNDKKRKYTLADLDTKHVLSTDPDGGKYTDYTNTYVEYTKQTTSSKASGYCVYLEGSKRVVKKSATSSACVPEEQLSDRSHVIDK